MSLLDALDWPFFKWILDLWIVYNFFYQVIFVWLLTYFKLTLVVVVIAHHLYSKVTLVLRVLNYFAHYWWVQETKLYFLFRLDHFDFSRGTLNWRIKVMLNEIFIVLHLAFINCFEKLFNSVPFLLFVSVSYFVSEIDFSFFFNLSILLAKEMFISCGLLIKFLHNFSRYGKQNQIVIMIIIQYKQILVACSNKAIYL